MMDALWMYHRTTLEQACPLEWSGLAAVLWELHRMELELSCAATFCAAWALGPPSRVVVLQLSNSESLHHSEEIQDRGRVGSRVESGFDELSLDMCVFVWFTSWQCQCSVMSVQDTRATWAGSFRIAKTCEHTSP